MTATISVLIPTRARVRFMVRLLDSMEKNVGNSDATEIWVYYDEDDPETADFAAGYQGKLKTHFHRGPRTRTMGQMLNALCSLAPQSDIYVTIPDDTIVLTRAWDDEVRRAFASVPDGIAMGHMDDLHGDKDSVSLVTLSRPWIEASGAVFTTHFPYWYDDMWLDHVATMVNRKVALPIQVAYQSEGNRNGRMRNLAFWERFFYHTADERMACAEQIRQKIYRHNPDGLAANRQAGNAFYQQWQRREHRLALEEIYYSENVVATEKRFQPPPAQYCEVENQAVTHLSRKSLRLRADGQMQAAEKLLEGLPYAAQIYTGLETGQPSPLGLNHSSYPQLRGWSRLRYQLLPVLLRLRRFTRIVQSKPLTKWPEYFFEVFRRWRLRRRGA